MGRSSSSIILGKIDVLFVCFQTLCIYCNYDFPNGDVSDSSREALWKQRRKKKEKIKLSKVNLKLINGLFSMMFARVVAKPVESNKSRLSKTHCSNFYIILNF